MYVYLQVLQERGKRGGEKRRGKSVGVCTPSRDKRAHQSAAA